jgi:hypothetical protein
MTATEVRQTQQIVEIPASGSATRRLLACGILVGTLFVGVSFVQAVTRQGFDLSRQPLSLLLLGDLGWIQLMNFEVVGFLSIAYAVGIRRLLHPGRAGTWGPLLVAGFGVGLIVAGIFGPDPSMGYPPGAPEGTPATMSTHSAIHGVGFFISLASFIGACLVFARRFAGLRERGWVTYCVASALVSPILVGSSGALMTSRRGGIPLFAMAIVFGAWYVLLALHLRREASSSTA